MKAACSTPEAAWAQVRSAQGRVPADLLVRNCRLVNVYSAELHEADIAVKDGRIVAIRRGYDGEAQRVVEAGGRPVAPGLVASRLATDLAAAPGPGVTSVIQDVTAGGAAPEPDSAWRQWSAARVGVPGVLRSEVVTVATGAEARRLLRRGLAAFPVSAPGSEATREFLGALGADHVDLARICLGRLGGRAAVETVREALGTGMRPAEAIALATLNPAIAYGLDHRIGSLSPGRFADFLLLDDLASFAIGSSYLGGLETGHG